MTDIENADPDLASAASAFADPRRARVLVALCDGRALPAGRLAREAGVAASTISSHLSLLMDRGLVTAERHGRYRYYRLATDDVEGVLEALARLAPTGRVTSLRASRRTTALRSGRTCYRHLAGRLGVGILRQLLTAGWVDGGDGRHHPGDGDGPHGPGHGARYGLTAAGAEALAAWGLPAACLAADEPLPYCVDWTEQEHHLRGPLGNALASHLFGLGWIRRGNVPRSVELTPRGRDGLGVLGLLPGDAAVTAP